MQQQLYQVVVVVEADIVGLEVAMHHGHGGSVFNRRYSIAVEVLDRDRQPGGQKQGKG